MFRLVLFLSIFLFTSNSVSADERFTLINEHSHEVPYYLNYERTYSDGAYFFSEHLNPSDGLRSSSLVRIDAVSGKRETLSDNRTYIWRPKFILPNYIVAGTSGLSVYDRDTVRLLGGKRLSESVSDAIVRDDILYLLQRNSNKKSYILSRFSLPGMRFIGEDTIGLEFNHQGARFYRGDIIGIQKKDCGRNARCRSLVKMSLEGKIKSALEIEVKGNKRRCDVIKNTIKNVFIIGCNPYYLIIDVDKMDLIFEMENVERSNNYDFAISDNFIFVRRRNTYKSISEETAGVPVIILDRLTGVKMGEVALPPGKLRFIGNTLIVTSVDKHPTMLNVAVYSIR